MEESPCSSFLKFLETVFCDGRLSSGERTLCVLTSATLCEVVAYYLLSHDFSHIVFIFCFTTFLTSCLFMRLELLPCRTPLFYCLNASVVWRRWFGTRTFSKSSRTHCSKLIHSFHLPQFFFSQYSGFSPPFGTSQSEDVIPQEIRHQLRHLGLLLQLVNPAGITDVTYLYL